MCIASRIAGGSSGRAATLAFGIAGYSGSGKTTLIERLLPRLAARGLRVGVLKHDAHRLDLDRDGKDTARIYAAGAAVVCAHDSEQRFLRQRSTHPTVLAEALADAPVDLDLVLVEGHKDAAIPKIVLAHPDPLPAIEGPDVLATLAWDCDRPDTAEQIVIGWLERAWNERAFGIGLLVGGRSSRMGLRKPMLDVGGRTLVERTLDRLEPLADVTLLVGAGRLPPELRLGRPVLPDPPGIEGPLGGLIALLRHDPGRAWLVVGCDQPEFGAAHVRWLRAARRPGIWAVLPRLAEGKGVEPFGAVYEPAARAELERAAARGERALWAAIESAPTISPTPPDELASGWLNVNTPAEWRALTGEDPREAP